LPEGGGAQVLKRELLKTAFQSWYKTQKGTHESSSTALLSVWVMLLRSPEKFLEKRKVQQLGKGK